MRVTLDNWNNGWFGVQLGISLAEIDQVVALLQKLKADPQQHFHIGSDYKASGGVGDIEVFVTSPTEPHNMSLSSTALGPGDEI
jgi:hypothetical protein